jgi:rubrerythrin
MADTRYGFDALPDVMDADALFRVAVAMEAEAARRYQRLAARMDEAGQTQLATLFRELEAEEREHETGIEGWADRQGIDASGEPDFRWQSPETLTEEQFAEAGGEVLMTPESALNLAIHNEERAFAFYIRIATESDDAQVRRYAERMASEEITHVARLRLARRRAYRERRDAQARPPVFESVTQLTDYAGEQRAEGVEQLRLASAGCRGAGQNSIARSLDAAIDQPAQATDPAATGQQALEIMDAELRRAETAYDRLIRTAEQTRDEALVRAAQQHTQVFLERLATLSDLRAALHAALSEPR